MERLGGREAEPTVVDNFRTMVRKIREAQDSPGLAQRRQARREALGLAANILGSGEEGRVALGHAFNNSFTLSPELVPDIYRTLLGAKVLRAVVLRELLGIRLHGPIPRPSSRS